MVGLALLLGVVRVASRRAGGAAMSHVHWRDPAIVKAKEAIDRDLTMLQTMERSLEAYRATAPEDERTLKERAAVLEHAARRLDEASQAAGLSVERRLPIRMRDNWTTRSVRLQAGRTPSELIEVVRRLPIPEGTWVEGAGCTSAGCGLVLSAATRQLPGRSAGGVAPRSLPPRPWWPPSAEVWDQVREASEAYNRHRTVVDELAGFRQVHVLGMSLEFVIVEARSEKYRTALADAIGAARSARLTEVEVSWVESRLRVSVSQRSADLESRLKELGRVWEERSAGPGTVYVLAPGRGQPQARARTSFDLPAGLPVGS